jgi:predicted site-specific integrase-resolvase
METSQVIGTAEACELLGVKHRSSIKRYVDEGKLTPLRKMPGDTGAWLFDRAEVVKLAGERDRAEAAS